MTLSVAGASISFVSDFVADTTTVSVRLAMASVIGGTSTFCPPTTMLSRAPLAKPTSVTVSLYVPFGTFRNVYSPRAPDVVVAFADDPLSATVAPGTARLD